MRLPFHKVRSPGVVGRKGDRIPGRINQDDARQRAAGESESSDRLGYKLSLSPAYPITVPPFEQNAGLRSGSGRSLANPKLVRFIVDFPEIQTCMKPVGT